MILSINKTTLQHYFAQQSKEVNVQGSGTSEALTALCSEKELYQL